MMKLNVMMIHFVLHMCCLGAEEDRPYSTKPRSKLPWSWYMGARNDLCGTHIPCVLFEKCVRKKEGKVSNEHPPPVQVTQCLWSELEVHPQYQLCSIWLAVRVLGWNAVCSMLSSGCVRLRSRDRGVFTPVGLEASSELPQV